MHFTEFHTRLAVYGLAVNEHEEILLTWFNGSTGAPPCWTMPGGGVEFEETLHDALVREFEEETGYVVTPGRLLAENHDTFPATADRAPVRSQRFLMDVTIESGTLGTVEVGGTTDFAEWVPLERARTLEPRARIVDVALDVVAVNRT
jgi:8-oxo-dGTP diphosphatase